MAVLVVEPRPGGWHRQGSQCTKAAHLGAAVLVRTRLRHPYLLKPLHLVDRAPSLAYNLSPHGQQPEPMRPGIAAHIAVGNSRTECAVESFLSRERDVELGDEVGASSDLLAVARGERRYRSGRE